MAGPPNSGTGPGWSAVPGCTTMGAACKRSWYITGVRLKVASAR